MSEYRHRCVLRHITEHFAVRTTLPDDIIKFLRVRDYSLIRELGRGACGKTVLLHDPQLDEHFVCKKFAPITKDSRQTLFSNFVRETKLLHKLYHRNVVRVFNYYLYPNDLAGYILMEYISGCDLDDFLNRFPETINDIFVQAISGFSHTESINILHRDIRPQNLMVSDDAELKIIDFGFGKQTDRSQDFDKSINLNLWCPPPSEFKDSIYDFVTEIYFVGKQFESIIQANDIDGFLYDAILKQMCQHEHSERAQSFREIEDDIHRKKFGGIGFTVSETVQYRNFADAVEYHITKIDTEAKYENDVERLEKELEHVFRSFSLQECVPDSAKVLRCVISGEYFYKRHGLDVWKVKNFLELLKSSSKDKKRIILLNLHTVLDAITRYDARQYANQTQDDDLPF